MSDRFALGAPGVYFGKTEPLRALTGVRMDVCAFVGVAPRGPARVPLVDEDWPLMRGLTEAGVPILNSVPVAVANWDDYRARFGMFEGPGLLPYAVAQFFAQGGQRAYVVRVVHAYGDARDLGGAVSFTTAAQAVASASLRVAQVGDFDFAWPASGAVAVSAANPIPISVGGQAAQVIGCAADDASAPPSGPGVLTLSAPLVWQKGALVVRADGRLATGALPGLTTTDGGPVILRARDEGSWGNRLSAGISFRTRPVALTAPPTATVLAVAPDSWVPIGSLLRVTLSAGPPQLAIVSDSRRAGSSGGPGEQRTLTLDAPISGGVAVGLEVIEAALHVEDGAGAVEDFDLLGLSPDHPRWLAAVVAGESRLVYPDLSWSDRDLSPLDATLPAPLPPDGQFSAGADRYQDLTPEDFFDRTWVPGDEQPGTQGVHSLVDLSDLSLLVAPDLYSPAPLPEFSSVISEPVGSPRFVPCVELPPPERQAPLLPSLDGLRLDPNLPDDLLRITALQQRLVDLADLLRSFIVLLDAPPKLHQRQLLKWRGAFSSAFAAAYHPWIAITRPDDGRGTLVRVNPAATAAGIIARQEILFGVQNGPANALAADVVSLDDQVSPTRHDELHQAGINVYLREPRGIRLTGARTLSNDRRWRQLNVRRLVTMLARALEQQCQWAVFEPNNATLRGQLRRSIRGLLSKLYRANAFSGSTEDQAFFVRCDDTLNDRVTTDAGRLIAEIGVAPAEPLEFLVVRLQRDGDSTISVEG